MPPLRLLQATGRPVLAPLQNGLTRCRGPPFAVAYHIQNI